MNNKECAKTLLIVGIVLGSALIGESVLAVSEKEINYYDVPEVTADDRAAHRDAYYEGYHEGVEDTTYRYDMADTIPYTEGWCDALDAVNSKIGRKMFKQESCGDVIEDDF